MGAPDWHALARDAADRGEILLAVDFADRGLEEAPDDVALQHVAVLALARAGATDVAVRRYTGGPLARSCDPDAIALGARLAKDLALRAEGEERIRGARRAASHYAAIGGSYPLVNAATLSVLGGEPEIARAHAAAALAALDEEPGSPWTEMTRAEALLVLGDVPGASAAITAAARAGLDPAATASAFRQFALLCDARGIGRSLLDPLRGPGVLHFCGHLIGTRFEPSDEQAVRTAIERELDAEPVASAYGALAAGADILIAEALLHRGAELHAVLPCSPEVFIAQSVRPSGEAWVARFRRCLASAESVTIVTPTAERVDDGLFAFTSELGMGLALLRARWLHAGIRQLAVWDGDEAPGAAGTAADVAKWRRRGGRTVVIPPPLAGSGADSEPASRPAGGTGRLIRALLFADVAGYSKVPDEALPRFSEVVMDLLAEVLGRHAAGLVTHNTWGDAVSAATHTAEQAARLALDMQEAVAEIDPGAVGLPSAVAFRLGLHVGPVYLARNAVRGRPDVVGEHVNRTARLEPVTPPGEVYVTDSFAAALELAGVDEFVCDYVGHLPGAKDIGPMRMHRLRRRTAEAA